MYSQQIGYTRDWLSTTTNGSFVQDVDKTNDLYDLEPTQLEGWGRYMFLGRYIELEHKDLRHNSSNLLCNV